MSAEICPLLDIALPQRSPEGSVLRFYYLNILTGVNMKYGTFNESTTPSSLHYGCGLCYVTTR